MNLKKHFYTKLNLKHLIIGFTLLPGIVGGVAGVAAANKKSNQLLSPLAEQQPQQLDSTHYSMQAKTNKNISKDKTTNQKQQKKQMQEKQNINYYINLSSSFLQKATDLANNTENQTQSEKETIINNLNKSLTAANKAVSNYPEKPEGYLMRATIYQRVTHLYPEAAQAAQTDLQKAKSLSQGEKVEIENNHPLEALPTKQAQIASRITIAGPNQAKQTTQKETTNTNATEGTAVIPHGKKQIKVNAKVKPGDLIYTTPLNNPENKALSVKEKGSNYFICTTNSKVDQELQFKWWVLENQE